MGFLLWRNYPSIIEVDYLKSRLMCVRIISWEPALETLNSQDDEDDDDDEVQKKALQFSAINSDFWA